MSNIIGLIGDYNNVIVAHTCIERSLQLLSKTSRIPFSWQWIDTSRINNPCELTMLSGIWLVPGSPYKNFDGALTAIRFARETKKPFLGTCGGFQHALIEFSRQVCGINDASHAELNAETDNLIITPLSCSLLGESGNIFFLENSQLSTICKTSTNETYYCRYGFNPEWKSILESHGMKFTGFDTKGQIRCFELSEHPFFIGALFQPERYALTDKIYPIIKYFVECAIR